MKTPWLKIPASRIAEMRQSERHFRFSIRQMAAVNRLRRRLLSQFSKGKFPLRQIHFLNDGGTEALEPIKRKNGKTGENSGKRALHSIRNGSLHCLIRQIEREDTQVGGVALELSGALNAYVACNAYLTPPEGKTFPRHWDMHDVLVFQLAGWKSWSLFKRRTGKLARYDGIRKIKSPLCEQFVLKPGDFLYIPKGIPHEAECHETFSFHLSFGIYPYQAIG